MSTTTTAPEEQHIKVTIVLRKGVNADFKKTEFNIIGDELKEEVKPNIGQPYWLRSMGTHEVDNRQYQISDDTDWEEFKLYMKLGMVYVPASVFELEDLDS